MGTEMEQELSHGKKRKKQTSPGISTWKSSFLPVLQNNFLSFFIFLQQDHPIPIFLTVSLQFTFLFFPRDKVLDDVRRLIQPGDVIGRTVFDLDEPRWVT